MKRVLFGICLLAMVALPARAQAELIEGQYNFTLGSVVVSLGEVDWTPTNPGNTGVKTYGTYDIDADSLRTGVFAHVDFSATPGAFAGGVAPVEPEQILDMSANPADPNFVPVGASGGVTDFFLIHERPTWEFTETFLAEGAGGTPFFFLEVGGSTTVSIFLFGFAFDTLTPTLVSNWSAVISGQYVGWTITEIVNCIAGTGPTDPNCSTDGSTPGSLPNNTWSGTFVATDAAIPEPATLLTFGVGAAWLAARRRRKAARS